MELFLQKYGYGQKEYLVYDCEQNQYVVEDKEIRVMCSTNFGLDVSAILYGPVMKKGGPTMLIYNPDGTLGTAGEAEKAVIRQYLVDAGYESKSGVHTASRISRIYLCEHFLQDNNILRAEKKENQAM